MRQFVTNDYERLLNKKIIGVGYDSTQDGYALVIIVKGKEFYLFSETPIELEIRDVQ